MPSGGVSGPASEWRVRSATLEDLVRAEQCVLPAEGTAQPSLVRHVEQNTQVAVLCHQEVVGGIRQVHAPAACSVRQQSIFQFRMREFLRERHTRTYPRDGSRRHG